MSLTENKPLAKKENAMKKLLTVVILGILAFNANAKPIQDMNAGDIIVPFFAIAGSVLLIDALSSHQHHHHHHAIAPRGPVHHKGGAAPHKAPTPHHGHGHHR